MSNSYSEVYLSEIFSSFQGEGGTVRGSCFGKRQIFIRFLGCNLYIGNFGTSGCVWCDSPQARPAQQDELQFEVKPNSQILKKRKNPINLSSIIELTKRLITPDLHSISFTGGEPLYQKEHLLKLSEKFKTENICYPLYLETNGSIDMDDVMINKLANNITYCCCDIKDKSSKAASKDMYDKLLKRELDFIKKFVALGVNTFAKLVITSQTEIKEVQYISKQLSEIHYSDGEVVGLALQPVSIKNNMVLEDLSLSFNHLSNLFEVAAEYIPVNSLTLSIQAHKYLNLL